MCAVFTRSLSTAQRAYNVFTVSGACDLTAALSPEGPTLHFKRVFRMEL